MARKRVEKKTAAERNREFVWRHLAGYCNCAGCGIEMRGLNGELQSPSGKGGRILDRPYCSDCLEPKHIPPGHYGPYKDDTSPGWENAIRILEDG